MSELLLNNFLLRTQDLESLALIDIQQSLTFAQLLERIEETCAILKDEGIESGENVGIIGNNTAQFVISTLALWQLSAVPVLLNTQLTEIELNELISLAKCKHVLLEDKLSGKYDRIDTRKIIYPYRDSKEKFKSTKGDIHPDEIAAIIFTSGTSQKPKGVKLSFNSFYQGGRIGNQLLNHTHSDKWLASLPFYHVGGFSIITRALLFGIPVVIPVSLKTEDLADSLKRFNPTFISLVPTQLKRLLKDNIKPNSELKRCLVGGGFADDNLVKAAINAGWKTSKVYGATETCSFVVALTTDAFNTKPQSLGEPVPPNKIRIVGDDDDDELNPYEIGEIAIWTPALMQGYINKADELSNKIINEYYYTGDMGYTDEDGFLFLEHRKNDLIVSGGENVNPLEVEKILIDHPSIEDAAVFPLRSEEWGEIVGASVVLKNDKEKISTADLQKYLKANLARFKVPKKIFIESTLPRAELGKVEKRKLIEKYSKLNSSNDGINQS